MFHNKLSSYKGEKKKKGSDYELALGQWLFQFYCKVDILKAQIWLLLPLASPENS